MTAPMTAEQVAAQFILQLDLSDGLIKDLLAAGQQAAAAILTQWLESQTAERDARIARLEAERDALRVVMERCAVIVDRYNFRQNEKVGDVPPLLRTALQEGASHGAT